MLSPLFIPHFHWRPAIRPDKTHLFVQANRPCPPRDMGVMRFKETLHERSLPVGRVFPNLPTVCVWNGGPARIRTGDRQVSLAVGYEPAALSVRGCETWLSYGPSSRCRMI